MEILSPAGSPEHITAAVRSGADAVYLGTQRFNARQNAENFDVPALENAIKYCHARGVKVYITLNTLIKDNELELAEKEIKTIAKLGADAVIIQDLAMVKLAKNIIPQMPLHASTQMSVHNLSGVKMLEKLGFSRVVPARELSLEELAHIRKNTSLELEVFVHGALCMCVSGQCYMSSVFGQRSANRGMCAQPCRLNFKVFGREHALSLKDLSAIDMLGRLKELGITSAKIEGRMKRPEYVAAATSACKMSLAGQKYDKEQLRAVFSRSGFTNGYMEGKPDINLFGFRTKDDVIAAVPVLKKIASNVRQEIPIIGVDMKLKIKKGEEILLTVSDGKNTVSVSQYPPEQAINRQINSNFAETALKKCGGTPFFVKTISCEIEQGLSVSMSRLNTLRKTALELLLKKRETIKPYSIIESQKCIADNPPEISQKFTAKKPELFAFFENETQICANVDKIILDCEILYSNPQLCKKYQGKLIAKMPALMFSENYNDTSDKLSVLRECGVDTLYAPNIYVLNYAKKHGFKIMGGYGLNIINSAALEQYRKLGIDMAEISFECSISRFNKMIKTIPCGLTVYGKMPLMTFRACPARSEHGCRDCNGMPKITDRLANEMTIMCHNKKYSQLLNPKPIYMADRLNEIQNADFISLHFTEQTHEECSEIINKYINRKAPDSEFTRGLYYKEIK